MADDAFAWLARAARRGERFDLVVLDPPSYSSTKRGRFVADSDYGSLAAAALAILAPGGRLLACTNHRGIASARFRRILFDAGRTAGRDIVQVKDLPEPPDFPPDPVAGPHMKSALVTPRGSSRGADASSGAGAQVGEGQPGQAECPKGTVPTRVARKPGSNRTRPGPRRCATA